MPFTLAHPAAVLPLARGPLVPSAVVCGSMAPDLPYYFSLQWIGGDYNLTLTHAASSLLWLDPLIALVLLVAFHLLFKRPLLALLPPAAAGRAWPAARGFRWRRAGAPGWIALSLVLGATTHLAWDVLCDNVGSSAATANLASGVLGGAVLLGWMWQWWRTTAPQPVPPGATLGARPRSGVLGVLLAVATGAGVAGAASILPEVQDDLHGQGEWSRVVLAQYAARTFVTDAGTALGMAVAAYAVGWHLNQILARRRAARGVDWVSDGRQ